MKALLFSDLHLDMGSDWRLPEDFPEYDVLLAAGDISGTPKRSIETLAAHPVLGGRPIVFVAGNHEFYGGVLESRIEEGQIAAAAAGVHYLDASAVVIDGVRFVGATLWTDFGLLGRADLSMAAAESGMTDYSAIKRRAYKVGDKGRFRWKPKDSRWHHAIHRRAIDQMLETPFDGPTVVVTHHAPSPRSLLANGAHRELDPAYATDLDELILHGQPVLWVHGHIHRSVDYWIGPTWVRSNPKGYGPHGKSSAIENTEFRADLIVEIPDPALDLQPRAR